jgi:hypothetical protein
MTFPTLDTTGTNHIKITNNCHTPQPLDHHLLEWNTEFITYYTICITSALTGGVLHIFANGVYINEFQKGYHSWVLSDNKQNMLW